MSSEVASTRLSKETLREIDREASTRGLSRSVYLSELIEQRASYGGSGSADDRLTALVIELRELRDGYRNLLQGLRELRTAVMTGEREGMLNGKSTLIDRLAFSALFSEALLKRLSATLYRNPSELSQVVREARDQAEAEAKRWREGMQKNPPPPGPP